MADGNLEFAFQLLTNYIGLVGFLTYFFQRYLYAVYKELDFNYVFQIFREGEKNYNRFFAFIVGLIGAIVTCGFIAIIFGFQQFPTIDKLNYSPAASIALFSGFFILYISGLILFFTKIFLQELPVFSKALRDLSYKKIADWFYQYDIYLAFIFLGVVLGFILAKNFFFRFWTCFDNFCCFS